LAFWSQGFDGKPEMVQQARRFALAKIGGHPPADDAALVLTELSANAIKHTASGGPGGRFVVEVERCEGYVQVAVTDMGGTTEPTLSAADPASAADVTGRGLFLVDALAVKWGCEQKADGRRVWAIVTAEPPGTVVDTGADAGLSDHGRP
jgi:serine/threonine-protein kinase RsbW